MAEQHGLYGIIPADLQPAFASPVRGAAVQPKLCELLGVEALPTTASVLASWDETARSEGPEADGVSWVKGTFANSLGQRVPTVLVLPPVASATGCGVVCVPGTGGSAEQLADARIYPDDEPAGGHGVVLGWARELARRGFACVSITVFGCTARNGHISGLWDQQTKYLTAYGRPPMVGPSLLVARAHGIVFPLMSHILEYI
jgi:hypothetical protein